MKVSSRLVAASVAVVLLAASGVKAADVSTARTVILVRHAEKSAADGDVPLSAAGHERAALLAWMLKDTSVSRIFTSQTRRAKETAAPLAEQLKIDTEVLPAQDPDALLAVLRTLPRGSTALVVGHSNTVPLVVAGLGAPKTAPFAEDEFDRLLVLTVAESTATVTSLRYGRPRIRE